MRQVLLHAKRADIIHHQPNLVRRIARPIRRHSVLAFGHDVVKLPIREALVVRRVPPIVHVHVHFFGIKCLASSVLAMAECAVGAVVESLSLLDRTRAQLRGILKIGPRLGTRRRSRRGRSRRHSRNSRRWYRLRAASSAKKHQNHGRARYRQCPQLILPSTQSPKKLPPMERGNVPDGRILDQQRTLKAARTH
jgi:hypothetical protein